MKKHGFIKALSLVLALVTLLGALQSAAWAESPIQVPSTGGWRPANTEYTEDGLTLYKQVLGSSGSQATGNLEYQLRLGAKLQPTSETRIPPVDFILVLDRSGSMVSNHMGANGWQYTYIPTTLDDPLEPDLRPSVPEGYDSADYVVNVNGVWNEVLYEKASGRYYFRTGRNGKTYFTRANRDDVSKGQLRIQLRLGKNETSPTRMEALKNVTTGFVDLVASKSADSRIGVVSYSTDVTLVSGLAAAGSNAAGIKRSIRRMAATGGTAHGAAMKKALELVEESKKAYPEREKVVLLFTDGLPDVGDTAMNDLTVTDALNAAQTMKDDGTMVVTIGAFGKDFDDSTAKLTKNGTQYKDKTIQWLMSTIASFAQGSSAQKQYYRADSEQQLQGLFEAMFQQVTVGKELIIENAHIRDYIDPRFQLTPECERNLREQGAVIARDEKGVYVEWTQTLSSGKDPDKENWTYFDITVEPVDRTLSGDELATNLPGVSAVYDKDLTKHWAFPEPHVQIFSLAETLHQTKTARVHGTDPANPDRAFDLDLSVWGDTQFQNQTVSSKIVLLLDCSDSMSLPLSYSPVGMELKGLEELNKKRIYSINPIPEDASDIGFLYGYGKGKTTGKPGWYVARSNGDGTYTYVDNEIKKYPPLQEGKRYYTQPTKMGLFQDELVKFINTVPVSTELAIVSFASGAWDETGKRFLNVGTDKEELIRIVDRLGPRGLTNTNAGLNIVKNTYFTEDQYNDDRIDPLLFVLTDGADNALSGGMTEAQYNSLAAVKSAKALRAKGVKVSSFGVGWETAKDYVAAFLKKLCSTPVADHYRQIDDLSILAQSMVDTIAKTIEYYTGLTIRDYIDPRFELVDAQSLRPLSVGAAVNGGTVGRDEHGWYVEWKNQRVKASGEEKDSWRKTLTVKARDDFFGGNAIETNLPGYSAVYTDEGQLLQKFDKPRVNVPVDFTVGNARDVIFFGDEVSPEPALGMFDETRVQNGAVSFHPGYLPSYAGRFTYEWYRNDGNGNPTGGPVGTQAAFPQGQVLPADGSYTLCVTFHADVSNVAEVGIPVGDVTRRGQYTVKVESGVIEIEKRIDSEDTDAYQGDPIFQFQLDRLDDAGRVVETSFAYVRFTDANQGRLTAQPFTHLSRGRYRVTELATMRYQLDSIAPESANGTVKGETVEFSIGPAADGGAVAPLGKATFYNTKQNDRFFTGTDIKSNRFRVDLNAPGQA